MPAVNCSNQSFRGISSVWTLLNLLSLMIPSFLQVVSYRTLFTDQNHFIFCLFLFLQVSCVISILEIPHQYQWKSEGTYEEPLRNETLYSNDNNKNSEKLSILDQSFSIVRNEFTKCNTDIYVCFDAALLFDCQGVIS